MAPRESLRILLCLSVLFVVSMPCDAGAVTMQSTLHFSSEPYIHYVDFASEFHGYQSAVDRDSSGGRGAYDYSVHIMYDQSLSQYRLYWGGRWLQWGSNGTFAEGDHILLAIIQDCSFLIPAPRPS